jgi:putative MFS transporter
VFKRLAAIQVLTGGAALSSFTYIAIYAGDMGLSKFQITLVALIYAIAALFSAYLFGRAADHYGKRVVLVIGLSGGAVMAMTEAFGWDFVSISSFRLLAGIGFGMFPAALSVYAYEANFKIGKFSSFGALGWGIALPISGYLAGVLSVRAVFLYSSALLWMSFLLALTLPKVKERIVRTPLLPMKMIIKNRQVLVPLIIRHSTASAIWVLWPLYLHERIGLSFAMIGIVQATNALTQFAAFYLLGDKVPPRPAFIVGLVLSGIAAYSFTVLDSYPLFLLTQVILGMSWAFVYIGALRLMLHTNEERGTVTGLLNSSIGLSALIGPLIAIAIVAVFPGSSYEGPMYLTAAASLIVGLSYGSIVLFNHMGRRLRSGHSV